MLYFVLYILDITVLFSNHLFHRAYCISCWHNSWACLAKKQFTRWHFLSLGGSCICRRIARLYFFRKSASLLNPQTAVYFNVNLIYYAPRNKFSSAFGQQNAMKHVAINDAIKNDNWIENNRLFKSGEKNNSYKRTKCFYLYIRSSNQS